MYFDQYYFGLEYCSVYYKLFIDAHQYFNKIMMCSPPPRKQISSLKTCTSAKVEQ